MKVRPSVAWEPKAEMDRCLREPKAEGDQWRRAPTEDRTDPRGYPQASHTPGQMSHWVARRLGETVLEKARSW